jgi:S-adenosyl methyltransferase
MAEPPDPTPAPSPAIDTSVPRSARIWNYWLGGTDNYPVDREAGEQYKKLFPGIVTVARVQRQFLARVVRFLAADADVRQFLDVGTGLPTGDNTHQVAQRAAPSARVVYVDNDPLVLTHARALLTSAPEGDASYLEADLGDPERILELAATKLDLSQPVALMLMGIMGHSTDVEAYPAVRWLLRGLPSGSYLALADGANTSRAFNEAQRRYNESGAAPYYLRSPEQIARFFDGLELVDPGVVPCGQWRPGPGPSRPASADVYGGVGRKP